MFLKCLPPLLSYIFNQATIAEDKEFTGKKSLQSWAFNGQRHGNRLWRLNKTKLAGSVRNLFYMLFNIAAITPHKSEKDTWTVLMLVLFFSQKFISGITPRDNWKAYTELISSLWSGITMPYKKRQLRELLQGFAEQTTAHGISQIASSKSFFWRLFWVLVTLGGGGMVIYQGILLFNTYMSKPIKSDIDITYRRVSSVFIFQCIQHC